MKAYFFLWNPKKDPDSFRDYDQVQEDVRAGKPYITRWICPSKQPRRGDIAILQRTGNLHNGVFAKGIVTDEPYLHKGVQVVGLQLDAFLPIGQEITRNEIVTAANYAAKWMPMASGNVVPVELVEAIQSIWKTRSRSKRNKRQPKRLYEGAPKQIWGNVYERNNEARRRCIEHYGLDCRVCGFNFEKAYGSAGAGFIHVHHLKPLSTLKQNYEVDPKKDLLPVCPNCHAMIHSRRPMYTIAEVKSNLRGRSNKAPIFTKRVW